MSLRQVCALQQMGSAGFPSFGIEGIAVLGSVLRCRTGLAVPPCAAVALPAWDVDQWGDPGVGNGCWCVPGPTAAHRWEMGVGGAEEQSAVPMGHSRAMGYGHTPPPAQPRSVL